MNFDTILEDCKLRYKKFDKKAAVKRKPRSFERAILEKKSAGHAPVIAEIKYASPSGRIRDFEDPKDMARQMIAGGACGISVLTESKYFGGSLDNLRQVSKVSSVPVLRKDFLFDISQIYETYYHGADSLLLIASFFSESELELFIEKSRELGMEPLVEVHSQEDVRVAKAAGARIYVLNNRDKNTLRVDLDRSRVLAEKINGLKIGASGIESVNDLQFVLKHCDAALVGSSIMRSADIEKKVREFVYGR